MSRRKNELAACIVAAFAVGAAVVHLGCSVLAPLKHPRRDLLDCYAKALEPVAGEVFDSAELAKDLVAGKASLAALLGNLQVDEKEADAVATALHACVPAPAPAPALPPASSQTGS